MIDLIQRADSVAALRATFAREFGESDLQKVVSLDIRAIEAYALENDDIEPPPSEMTVR
jgi:hypothetical protein